MILNKIYDRLAESLTDVDSILRVWIPPEVVKKANEVWEERVKTQKGQNECLSAAANSDKTAVNYLYNRFFPLVQKVFWKYYVGPNKELGVEKLSNQGVIEFASTAYSMLAGINNPSPYRTFTPEKASKASGFGTADIINLFSYYYYRYLQSEAFKQIRKERPGAFSGYMDHSNIPSVASYDEYFQNSDLASDESFEGDETTKNTLNKIFDEFSDWLEAEKGKRYKDIFEGARNGEDFEDIAKRLGMTGRMQVRNHFNRIKNYFMEQYPDIKLENFK